MDKPSLVAKRNAVEKRFNELEAQRSDIVTELSRLQGEYRMLNGMIAELEDPATTIDVEPTLKKEEKHATKS